jgi:hypothetical protein
MPAHFPDVSNGVAMNAVNRYLVNTVQAKTGLSAGVLIGYAVQAALVLATAVLFLVAAFFVLSDWLGFGPTSTALGMFLVFAALSIASMVWTSHAKTRSRETAERALGRSSLLALSPPVISAGLRLGSSIGWRRVVPVALVSVLATGVAAEWSLGRRGRARPEA